MICKKATRECPCGYAGDPVRECRCTPQQIARYGARVSGPLRDRIDLTVEVPAVPPDVLHCDQPGESSAAVRERVLAARHRQRERVGPGGGTNSQLSPAQLSRHCPLEGTAIRLLAHAVQRLGLTARSYDRARKVARTIADLTGSDAVTADHVAESLQFRF